MFKAALLLLLFSTTSPIFAQEHTFDGVYQFDRVNDTYPIPSYVREKGLKHISVDEVYYTIEQGDTVHHEAQVYDEMYPYFSKEYFFNPKGKIDSIRNVWTPTPDSITTNTVKTFLYDQYGRMTHSTRFISGQQQMTLVTYRYADSSSGKLAEEHSELIHNFSGTYTRRLGSAYYCYQNELRKDSSISMLCTKTDNDSLLCREVYRGVTDFRKVPEEKKPETIYDHKIRNGKINLGSYGLFAGAKMTCFFSPAGQLLLEVTTGKIKNRHKENRVTTFRYEVEYVYNTDGTLNKKYEKSYTEDNVQITETRYTYFY